MGGDFKAFKPHPVPNQSYIFTEGIEIEPLGVLAMGRTLVSYWEVVDEFPSMRQVIPQYRRTRYNTIHPIEPV